MGEAEFQMDLSPNKASSAGVWLQLVDQMDPVEILKCQDYMLFFTN